MAVGSVPDRAHVRVKPKVHWMRPMNAIDIACETYGREYLYDWVQLLGKVNWGTEGAEWRVCIPPGAIVALPTGVRSRWK